MTDVCELCSKDGGELLWRDALCRVVRVGDADYPGFLRVILNRHVAEMSDLPSAEQSALMQVVFAAERALRTLLAPDKINLASFGNVVPHLHWHVIPRWRDDRHFPQPVWGSVQNAQAAPRPAPDRDALAALLRQQLDSAA
jgi:diadenosine tetraphosphate (Ap4A) HIT family hydrolase